MVENILRTEQMRNQSNTKRPIKDGAAKTPLSPCGGGIDSRTDLKTLPSCGTTTSRREIIQRNPCADGQKGQKNHHVPPSLPFSSLPLIIVVCLSSPLLFLSLSLSLTPFPLLEASPSLDEHSSLLIYPCDTSCV